MYFVQMGEVEVLPSNDSSPIAVFKEGDTFGEVSELQSIIVYLLMPYLYYISPLLSEEPCV